MNLLRRRAGILFALVIVGVLILSATRGVSNIRDRNKVASMTKRMKTVCVGRFLIDLPDNAVVSFSRAFVDGFEITSRHDESDEQFASRVNAAEAEAESQLNQRGKKSLESSRPIQQKGWTGKVLVFGREWTEISEGQRKVVVQDVKIHGFARSAGVSYTFKGDGMSPEAVADLRKMIEHLQARAPDEIPGEPGFCIDRGVLLDSGTHAKTEWVNMFAGLPGHPDLNIVFSTMAGTKRGAGMLARSAAARERLPFFMRAAFTTLKEGKREINGLAGEESLVRIRELNFTTGFSFDWEMGGREDDVHAPLLTLELETGTNPRAGGKPVQSSLTEEALIELWEKISSSIRPRPAGPSRVVDPGPPAAPLGTVAIAGELCPQTGWWQCGDPGSGVGVLGGQRQFLRQGQRMPQTLLLTQPTLWERLRKVQPSYESSTPTAWKLVDKRAHARIPRPERLAPATLPKADALASTSGAGRAGDAGAPLGAYVKTGEVCPASGWWRCMDSNSLDGTRWFARGSLLPVATLKVPPGVFGKATGGPEVIQRRSNWQLVRIAESDGPPAQEG